LGMERISLKRRGWMAVLLICTVLGSSLLILSAPAPQVQYGVQEDNPYPFPPDAHQKMEWAFARVVYQKYFGSGDCFPGGFPRWGIDSPKAERQLAKGVRRLTRIDARITEELIDPNSDEIFNWPWIYAVEVGSWTFTDSQVERLRKYFERGGFLMVDDFHGSCEWDVFVRGIHKVLPDSHIQDIPNGDEIFHTLYDLDERFQVPGAQFLYSHRIYEKDGFNPEWRGIRDAKGRVIVAICHNMDLGDAWEWSDRPEYPERFTSLAYRIGINYLVYSMTH
jgi:Domain of unknown function (DUF4159)